MINPKNTILIKKKLVNVKIVAPNLIILQWNIHLYKFF